MKTAVLVNVEASSYNNPVRKRLLREFCEKQRAELIELKRPFWKNMKIPHSRVFVAGGDGTFQGALNQNMFRNKAIGYFPLGAGNAIYSTIYQNNSFRKLKNKIKFVVKEMDVIEVTWGRKRCETLFLSAGFDAQVVAKTVRKSPIRAMDYMAAAAKATFAESSWNVDFYIDGERRTLQVSNITLGKIEYYGYKLKSLPGKPKPADGLISGISTRKRTPYPSAERLLHLLTMNVPFRIPQEGFIQGRKIEVRADKPMPLQAGGEFLGYTKKFTCRIVRKQKILVPA